MDRSCQAQLMAKATGQPVLINPETASLTDSQIGSDYMGWLSFQSLYDKIVYQEPDLLD